MMLVSASRLQLLGMVRHSSPAWVKRRTSPPKTQGWFFKRLRPVPKGDTFHWVTWNEALTMDCSFSLVACRYLEEGGEDSAACCQLYLSVATDTKMTSSPTLTFSPSDLCLEAG